MKDGKTELSGKDKMNDLLKQIQNILSESNIETSASQNIENHSEEIENQTKGLKAFKKKKVKKNRSNEEDLADLSKKDLEDKSGEEESSTEDEKVETPDESPSTIDLADAKDFDKLKDNLNQFRASHSLSDAEVSEELKKYFERLASEEKRILHVFIKGLTQVTLLDVSGKTAYIPSDLKFKVTKAGAATSEKIKSKARSQKLKKKKDIEDATNTPIVIGSESIQEKRNIMRIVKENA